jgi:hypothetical protein
MKFSANQIGVWSIALALSFFLTLVYVGTSLSQSTSKLGEENTVKPVLKSAGEKEPASHSSPAAAAVNNLELSSALIWTFGSKQQRGWYLYTPLIKRLINTQHDPATPQFASAVARWQSKAGVNSSGILDEETLYAMIKTWQDARLKDRSPALPEQLLTAPIPDFYDPTRAEELRQVERQTYAAYKRMVAAAISERSLGLAHTSSSELAPGENYLKIISAYRSREYQDKLRRETPHSGTAGLAVNSPHFTGRALDLYVGGDPVDARDSNRALQVATPVYKWLVRNAERFGFRPYCYEPWHWEYVR